jgi:hypothetical protein
VFPSETVLFSTTGVGGIGFFGDGFTEIEAQVLYNFGGGTVSSQGGGQLEVFVNGEAYDTQSYGEDVGLEITEPPGNYIVTAQYLGGTDSFFGFTLDASPVSNSVDLEVLQGKTSIVLTPTMSSVSAGQPATFSAAVSPSFGAPGTKMTISDGTVQFLVDGSNYGDPVPVSNGAAQESITEPGGSYRVTAKYLGDGTDYAASEVSTAATLNVAGQSVYPTSLVWGQYGLPGYTPADGYTDGVTTYAYNVVGTLSEDVPVALYWSPTGTFQSTDMLVDGTEGTIAAGTTAGGHTGYVDDRELTSPPSGTQYLLVVIGDPTGQGFDASQNVSSAHLGLAVTPVYQYKGAWTGPNNDLQYTTLGHSSTDTIASSGCALTSLVMSLGFNGVSTDPYSLDEALSELSTGSGGPGSAEGYVGKDKVNWIAATNIASAGHVPFLQWNSQVTSNADDLRDLITEYAQPVIVSVTNPTDGSQHFVLVTGLFGDTFSINDPGYSDRTTLDYYGSFTTRGFVQDPDSDHSELSISLDSASPNVNLAVLDSVGNVTGTVAAATSPLGPIPGSTFFSDGPVENLSGQESDDDTTTQFVYVAQPQGSYDLITSGVGAFTINVFGVTPSGQLTPPLAFSGTSASATPAIAPIQSIDGVISALTESTVSGAGTYAGTATLTATLTSADSPLSGETVAFTLNHDGTAAPIGTAMTNASGVATLSGVNLTGFNAGTFTGAVGASFAGDSTDSATSASGDLTVSPAPATLTLSGLSATYDGMPQGATVRTSPAGLNGVTVSYSQNNVAVAAPTQPGNYAVVATLNNPNYTAPNATGTLAINPATPTSTPTPTPTPTSTPTPPPTPPQVVGGVNVSQSKKSTLYTLTFAAPLNSASANNPGLYQVLQGVTKRKKTEYTKPLKIKSVVYNPGPDTVTILLAKTYKGRAKVVIQPGLEGANGATSGISITEIVP